MECQSLSLIHLVLQFLLVTQITHQQKSLTSAINIFHQHKFDGPNIVFPSEVSFSSLLTEAQNPKLFLVKVFGVGQNFLDARRTRDPESKGAMQSPVFGKEEGKQNNQFLPPVPLVRVLT